MKQIFKLATVLFFTSITQFSFAQKKEWKEMHAFHAVMSKTFHPAEEGNLQPVKNNATLLLAKAEAWKASTPPAGYDIAVTTPILTKLIENCTAIKDAVNNKQPNEALKTLITQAHETFHQIMEKCRK